MYRKKEEGQERQGIAVKKVITYGSFDLFHEGHYRLLKRAKELGDYLIVGVTTEQYDRLRGKLNVEEPLLTRVENIKRTGLADEIIIEDHPGQKEEDIEKYGIDVFTVGSDWTGAFDYLKGKCEVVYLERTKDISSTMLREKLHPIIRLGVVGTGRIANRLVAETKFVSGIQSKSVYNPHKESAVSFAGRYGLSAYYGEYEQFLNEVDAVYIASPHEFHYGYTKAALLQGKHVLCEKPLTFSRQQAEELYKIAGQRGLVLMEALKTAYCPGFEKLCRVVDSGIIGQVCDVEACFTRLTAEKSRERTDEKYGGGFTEFGSHTMLPILRFMGTDYKDVQFHSILDEQGIDLYTKANFVYEKGMATSKSGVGVKSEGQLIVAGTKGYVLAPSPWWLTKYFEVRYEDPGKIDKYTVPFYGDGLRYEVKDFAVQINKGQLDNNKFGVKESVALAGVMERFMELRDGRNGR